MAVAYSFLFSVPAFAQSPTLQTDQPDYAPVATAILTVDGFGAGEQVVLQVHHADATPDSGADHEPWTVTADEGGAFVTTWHVCVDDCLGATLRASADGQSSGLHAEVLFTDAVCPQPNITGDPSSATKCIGDAVTFSVTATGSGTLKDQLR